MQLYQTPIYVMQKEYREEVIKKIMPALRQEEAKLHDVIHEILANADKYPKEGGQ